MNDALLCLLWFLLGILLPLVIVWRWFSRCGADTESTFGPCRNHREKGRWRCHLHDKQLLSKADLAGIALLLATVISAWLWLQRYPGNPLVTLRDAVDALRR